MAMPSEIIFRMFIKHRRGELTWNFVVFVDNNHVSKLMFDCLFHNTFHWDIFAREDMRIWNAALQFKTELPCFLV
jgi:hypothetical protein